MGPNTFHRLAVAGLLGAVAMVFFVFEPGESRLFPSCPFHWATGLFCPGCGSQRALHDLLHLRVDDAFRHNPALILALPLLGIQWGLGRVRKAPFANDNRVVWAWGAALIGWGILRNLPGMDLLAP